jgi:hypothetical protein
LVHDGLVHLSVAQEGERQAQYTRLAVLDVSGQMGVEQRVGIEVIEFKKSRR